MIEKKNFDLEERTSKFGEKILKLCKKIPKSIVATPIVDQLVRAGTSVGANYCEANGASSKRDFANKIFICKKESKESQYWLRMLATAVPEVSKECRQLWQEAKELSMIFAKIASKSK